MAGRRTRVLFLFDGICLPLRALGLALVDVDLRVPVDERAWRFVYLIYPPGLREREWIDYSDFLGRPIPSLVATLRDLVSRPVDWGKGQAGRGSGAVT